MKRPRELGEGLDYSRNSEDIEEGSTTENTTLPTAKSLLLDSDLEDETSDRNVIKCSLPPHREPIAFKSHQEYESHYARFHTNRCLECRKNFPSEHLLSVHIEEWHDPLVRIKRDKGEHTYSCFVEGCERKCLTHQKRRLHMIDKHMYPRNFFFGLTKDGIDGRRSLLVEDTRHRRRPSIASLGKVSTLENKELVSTGKNDDLNRKPSESTAEATQPNQRLDVEMANLEGAMSALRFVPASIRSGRRRAGLS
ncbi:hypothetical protein E4U57_003341 [Claviceps arundinis]|uniref:C2H2-type domain-containing protein n=1 Tax=Claviceps arundinis TaxID=1623583 RepID=A0ABQ7PJU6_9HYPO|nr:hypothetical protein E4U57_003341 [Claviceps arundinis]